jgi:hypothetical protein
VIVDQEDAERRHGVSGHRLPQTVLPRPPVCRRPAGCPLRTLR